MPDWSELLRDHRPLLVYDSRETYFADAASSLVGNAFGVGPGAPYRTRLLRGQEELWEVAGGAGLTIDSLSDRYSEQLEAHEDDYLVPGPEPAADARRLHESEDHANVIYGRVAPAQGRWALAPVLVLLLHEREGRAGRPQRNGPTTMDTGSPGTRWSSSRGWMRRSCTWG